MSNADALELRISRAGKVIGSFKPARVQELLVTGVLLRTDHYWREGMKAWGRLDEPELDLSAMKIIIKPTPSDQPTKGHFDESPEQDDGTYRWRLFIAIKLGVTFAAVIGLAYTAIGLPQIIQPERSSRSGFLSGFDYPPVSPGSIGQMNAIYIKMMLWFAGWTLCVIIANSLYSYLERKADLTERLKLLEMSTKK